LFQLGSGASLGRDTIFEDVGSGGSDSLEFNGATTTGVTVNLGIGHVQSVHTNLELFLVRCHAIENVLGTGAADFITGNSLDNRLEGRGGADILEGGLGSDTLVFASEPSLAGERSTETRLVDALPSVPRSEISKSQASKTRSESGVRPHVGWFNAFWKIP
ncbi:MAG: hypothetical protein AB7O66_24720, partial [Limisphaerales bacterium]